MMEPHILYEDDTVLVINKPAGLIVHSDGRTVEPSVADWVIQHFPQMKEVGEPWVSPQGERVARPGIVHRLDRTTSGVLILGKTNEAYDFLKTQFGERSTEKTYFAYGFGHPKKDKGTIEAEIVRIRSAPPRWGVKRESENKKHRAAITLWQVLSRGTDRDTGEACTFFELSPKTGRTHQLRVHLKYLGYPIVCDALYATGKPCLLGFMRPALHASSLAITLPSGERTRFEAPLPEDFVRAKEQFIPA